MYTKKTVVLAKIETVSGTDSVPTAADNAIMAFDASITVKADMKERGPGNADRSLYPEIRAKTVVELKFSVELKGSGTAGTAPRFGALLRACDRAQTIVSSTSVTYAPATTSETVSIYVNIDGIYHKVLGCAGDVEIDLTAAEKGMINFTFTGVYQLPTDVTCPTPTFDSTNPLMVKGITYTFGSYAAIIEKLMLKFGNKVVERTDFNQAEAVLAFMVTDRKPEGTMTLEAVLRATSNADFWDYFHSRTAKALSFVQGATAGNIVTITAPVCYLRAPEYGDRDGLRVFDVAFQMARSSGNDEMSIAFT